MSALEAGGMSPRSKLAANLCMVRPIRGCLALRCVQRCGWFRFRAVASDEFSFAVLTAELFHLLQAGARLQFGFGARFSSP